MNLLAPAMLFTALLSIPILLLYMLKLRRRETTVSSTMLWQQLLRDRQANTPWQKLKRNLLLFLQLLILAAIVFALARPTLPVPGVSSGATIILLDASASMNAADVNPNRFDVAKARARSLIAALPSSAPVTLILAGAEPRLMASGGTDRALTNRALDSARAEQGGVNWEAAFALAAGAASAYPGDRPAVIVLISDGGLPQQGLPPLPGEFRYLPVGESGSGSGENLAILNLSVRPAAGGPQLFARVHNYGSQPRRTILSLYTSAISSQAEPALFDARPLDIPPAESREVFIENLEDVPQRLIARLNEEESTQDAFGLDDSAYAVYQPAGAGRTLLASRGNIFLRQLLQSLPGIQPFEVIAAEGEPLEIPTGDYDVTILDGIVPDVLPDGSLLLINPPENDLFEVGETVGLQAETRILEHPLTRFVDFSNVHVRRARQIELPTWAAALVTNGDQALVFSGETDGRRIAVVAFDLHDSDLPLQIAYPILFSNLMQYLSRPVNLSEYGAGPDETLASSGLHIQPGDSVLIRPPNDTTAITVSAPDGQTTRLTPDEGQAVFPAAALTGFYTVDYGGGQSIPNDIFAANLFNPQESDIAVRPSIRIGQSTLQASVQTALGQRELWPYLAVLALLVLLAEWLVYQRGQSLPAFWNRFFSRSKAGG